MNIYNHVCMKYLLTGVGFTLSLNHNIHVTDFPNILIHCKYLQQVNEIGNSLTQVNRELSW